MGRRSYKLGLETTSLDGTDVLKVSGEIDLSTASQLNRALSRLTAAELVIDLRGVTFIDSAGIHTLLRAREQASDRGGEVRLCVGSQRHITQLLEVLGLVESFQIDEG